MELTAGGAYSGWSLKWAGLTVGGAYSGWSLPWVELTVGGDAVHLASGSEARATGFSELWV